MIPGDVSKKYQIPIEHFDYSYIGKCEDVKELAKILRVLKGGDEGYFPDLEQFCERRIETLDPQNRLLRKVTPIQTKFDFPPEEWQQISGELTQWIDEMAGGNDEEDLPKSYKKKVEDEQENEADEDGGEKSLLVAENLPPVRGTNVVISKKAEPKPDETPKEKENENKIEEPSKKPEQKKKKKRPMPRSYREWDKVNVEEELKKVEEEEEKERKQQTDQPKPTPKPPESEKKEASSGAVKLGEINRAALSEDEMALVAERDKIKGNEAFRAGDFEEALAYYNRSLSLQVTMAVLNNRAFTYLKLEKWDHAIKDCNTVLAEDPKNVKALFRRATAYKSRKQFAAAKKDLEKVLSIDGTHQKAVEMLDSVKKSMESTKKEGNRLVIEEVSEEEEGEGEGDTTHFSKNTLSHRQTNGENAPSNSTHAKQTSSDAETGSKKVDHAKNNNNKIEQEVRDENKKNKSIWGEDEVLVQRTDAEPKKSESSKVEPEKSDVKKLKSEAGEIKVKIETKVEPVETKVKVEANTKVEPKKEAVRVEINEIPAGDLLDELTKLKDSAGKLFTAGQFSEALGVYEKAIDSARSKSRLFISASTSNSTSDVQSNNLHYVYGLLLANAAACQLKLSQFEACVGNCTESLIFVPRFAKSHLRRATAFEALERHEDALKDYVEVLNIEPASKPASEGRARCEAKLADVKKKSDESLGTRIMIEEEEDDDEESVDEVAEPVFDEEKNASQEEENDTPRKGKNSPRSRLFEKVATAPIVVEVPKLAPTAGVFEFAQAWTLLIKTHQQLLAQQNREKGDDEEGENGEPDQDENEANSEFYKPFWEFLRQIPSAQIAKVFANQLDGTSFSTIINCLYYAIFIEKTPENDEKNYTITGNYLIQLASIQRFTVAAMFLSEKDRNKLRKIVLQLIDSTSPVVNETMKQTLNRHFSSYFKK